MLSEVPSGMESHNKFPSAWQGSDTSFAICRGVVLLNGAGRIEDVQATVEAPVSAALSDTEKDVLSAIDPQDFSDSSHTAPGATTSSGQASTSSSQASASQSKSPQKPAPPISSSKEQTSLVQQVLAPLATIAKRVAVYGSFIVTKQPKRVKSVLQQVTQAFLTYQVTLELWQALCSVCSMVKHQLPRGIAVLDHVHNALQSHNTLLLLD